MQVLLDDPAARQRRMWWLRGAGAALVLCVPMLLAMCGLEAAWRYAMLIGYELLFLAPVALRLGAATQSGTLALEPGRVVITTARGRTVLRGKDLHGATTAFEPGGKRPVLTLSLGAFRAYPVSLTFDRVDDLESVRRALGVGQLGRGMVWIAAGRPSVARSIFRGFLLGLGLIAPFLVLVGADGGVGGGVLLFLAAIVGFFGDVGSGGTMTLWSDRLVVGTGYQRDEQPYTNVTGIDDVGDVLWIRTRGPGGGRVVIPANALFAPFSSRERALLVAQLRAAVARSRAAPPLRLDVGESLASLRRFTVQGERPAGWLSRLDAFAAVTEANRAGAGYRDASLDVEALWTVLEDPDADLELRCAAARVLHRRVHARAPDEEKVRLRIATAVESAADEGARMRLRLMTEDQPAEDELEDVFEPVPAVVRRSP